MNDDIQLAILAELRKLNSRHRPQRLTHADHLILAKLLPAIRGSRGSDAFTAKELLRDSVLRELTGGMNPNQLGILLSRAVNEDIAGMTVQNTTREHNAVLWMVVSIVP